MKSERERERERARIDTNLSTPGLSIEISTRTPGKRREKLKIRLGDVSTVCIIQLNTEVMVTRKRVVEPSLTISHKNYKKISIRAAVIKRNATIGLKDYM